MKKDKHIGYEVRELSHMIKRRIDESVLQVDMGETTCVQGWFLGYIYHHMQEGEVLQRDLEKEFKIRRSTVAGTLQLMEKKGLITRESVTQDARLKKITLTPKGMAIQEAVMRKIDEVEKRLSNGLTEGEKTLFFELIEKIKSTIKE